MKITIVNVTILVLVILSVMSLGPHCLLMSVAGLHHKRSISVDVVEAEPMPELDDANGYGLPNQID
uniref:Transmembrane protein n=2 Tax=Schistosoma mansoni TaxID=6183 RepID=A0A3Q0KTN0_SCHMA